MPAWALIGRHQGEGGAHPDKGEDEAHRTESAQNKAGDLQAGERVHATRQVREAVTSGVDGEEAVVRRQL